MSLAGTDLEGMRVQLVADAAAAVLVLLVAVVLSVFKPRGMTRHGQRKQHQQRGRQAGQRAQHTAPVP
ncbi:MULTISPECIES: hypothetical protein [unclassified Streptomyces]